LLIPPGRNLVEQIDALGSAKLISDEDALALAEGAAFLRSLDHAVRLITGKAAERIPEQVGSAEAVECLMRRWGLINADSSLAQCLRETQQRVRCVYRRLIGSE
jgi:glutamine synthetase adenylyltransferase